MQACSNLAYSFNLNYLFYFMFVSEAKHTSVASAPPEPPVGGRLASLAPPGCKERSWWGRAKSG